LKNVFAKVHQLWTASEAANLALVKDLLASKNPSINVNWIGPDRANTSLHRACCLGHLQVVEVLLQHPEVEVNVENKARATPFYLACQQGNFQVVKLLLADLRVDVNSPGSVLRRLSEWPLEGG